MNHIICSVLDKKAKLYHQLLLHRHAVEAIRAFEGGVKEQSSFLAKHPEDYALIQVGTWDDETCEFKTGDHATLAEAASLVENKTT